MLLVMGGVASGKRTFVRSLNYGAGDIVDAAEALGIPAFTHAASSPDASDLADIADGLASHEVVVMTEVGSGVVPLDAGERAWRERAGRLSGLLADRADCVVRMVCGIPQILKGAPVRKDGSPWSL